MFKDKRVVYGLIGGAALLIGAAIISHYTSGQSAEDQQIDDEIEKLGPLQRDNTNHIQFDQFIKIFEISSLHAKNEFSKKKKQYI